jgi:hypothetical protein
MKNRHRVSQVVSKLICSTGGQRKLLKQGIHGERETEKIGVAFGPPPGTYKLSF